VGICLNVSEQRRILKKARVNTQNLSDSDCHEILTASLKEDTPLTRRVQRYLDSKFRKALERWDNLSDTEYSTAWRNALDDKDEAADLYGLVTRQDLPKREFELFAGSTHTLSYDKWHQYKKLQSDWKILENRLENLEHKLEESRMKNSRFSMKEQSLLKALRNEKKANDLLQDRLDRVEKNSKTIRKQHQNIAELRTRLGTQSALIQKLRLGMEKIHRRNRNLMSLLKREKKANQLLVAEIVAQASNSNEEECEHCSSKALCKKCILMVGGITKLQNFYREIVVKKFEGAFEYHDGDLHNGEKALSDLVRKADYVLCPVDVNSHQACLSVKRYCKKWNKPYHILRNAGVSSIALALMEISQNVQN
jgi:DNA repair exonuclease SbcCD ATPase subunit